jgi:tetratricopeptide (TPR) repeat protein
MRKAGRAACLVAATALTGCVTTQAHEKEIEVPEKQMQAYLADKPAKTQRLYRKVLTQGERNAVLNHMRAGLAATELGVYDVAEQSFDKALLGIEAVYADNEDAEEARSTWVKENFKDFKGEPYERAMAYYYRGLLYLGEGDYENARASFEGGMLQDTLASQKTYQQDFALLAFLSGWASQCNGDHTMAADRFEEARDLNSAFAAMNADANILLIGETGEAPRKVAAGEYGELLTFERADGFLDQGVTFEVDGQPVPTIRGEDIFYQANTRGGREVDHILEGQATFKEGADTAGDALVAGGAATAAAGLSYGSDNAAAAGAAVAIVGLIAKGVAAATRPEADVRTWDNLPDKVHVATLTLEDVPEQAAAHFKTKAGSTVDTKTLAIHEAGACSIGWTRAHSALDVPDAAPGSNPGATSGAQG